MTHASDTDDHEWGFVAGLADGPASDTDDAETPETAGERAPGPAPVERVNAFRVGDRVLFRHYFEGDAAFATLKPYYNERRYRFEVPRDDLGAVETTLAEHGYELVVVADPSPYAVVVEKYTAHPETLFEDGVFQVSVDDYNVFVLTDRTAVDVAVAGGATRLSETPLSVSLPTRQGVGPVTVSDVGAAAVRADAARR